MANEQAWLDLEIEREKLQPTPPVGEPVTWFAGGDRTKPYPAVVAGIEGPGRVKLTVFPYNGMHQHKAAVYHTSHWLHDKANNTTKNCGSWDYPRGKAPKSDFATHEAELAKREENLRRGEEAARIAAEEFAKKQADRLAGVTKKKPLMEPLPANTF